jgi:hypothetical protein
MAASRRWKMRSVFTSTVISIAPIVSADGQRNARIDV